MPGFAVGKFLYNFCRWRRVFFLLYFQNPSFTNTTRRASLSFAAAWARKTVVPVAPLVYLWFGPVIHAIAGRVSSEFHSFQTASKWSLIWLELIYTSVSATIFETFECGAFDGNAFYLRAELTLACDPPPRSSWMGDLRLFHARWLLCRCIAFFAIRSRIACHTSNLAPQESRCNSSFSHTLTAKWLSSCCIQCA